jgi:hypothetical protein
MYLVLDGSDSIVISPVEGIRRGVIRNLRWFQEGIVAGIPHWAEVELAEFILFETTNITQSLD